MPPAPHRPARPQPSRQLDNPTRRAGLIKHLLQEQGHTSFTLFEASHEQSRQSNQPGPSLALRNARRKLAKGACGASWTRQPVQLILRHQRFDLRDFPNLVPQRFRIQADQHLPASAAVLGHDGNNLRKLLDGNQAPLVFGMTGLTSSFPATQAGHGYAAGRCPIRGRAAGRGPDGPPPYRPRIRWRHDRDRPALFRDGAGQGRADHRVLRSKLPGHPSAAGAFRRRLPGGAARAPKGNHSSRHQAHQRDGHAARRAPSRSGPTLRSSVRRSPRCERSKAIRGRSTPSVFGWMANTS